MNINNNINSASRFYNLRNFFTLRSLAILAITLVLSFSVRWSIVHYFNYDLSAFKDFFLIGLLVSLVRPLTMDAFDMFYPKLDISLHEIRELPDQSRLTSDRDNERYRRTYSNIGSFQTRPSDFVDRRIISDNRDHKDFKYKAKRRLLWII